MDVTVLVSSWDGWNVLWKPFAHAWTKFWPDCPWPTMFVTNERQAPLGTIPVGENTNWTYMTRAALREISSPTVLFIHDDCWLVHLVDTQAVEDFAQVVNQGKAEHVRFWRSEQSCQGGQGSYEPDPRLYCVDPAFPYFLNLQASLWNREALLALLHDNETCWQFETTGSGRGRTMGMRALCVDAATTPDQWNGLAYLCYINAVGRGRWRANPRKPEDLGKPILESPLPSHLKRLIGMEDD